MTHPPALHVGLIVRRPDGRHAPITARQAGPLTLWKTSLDERPCWRDDQLALPDEERPAAVERCGACRSGIHCDGDGGTMIDGVAVPCGCARCTGGPATGGTCCDCGTSISPKATRCRSCHAKNAHAQRAAQLTGVGA